MHDAVVERRSLILRPVKEQMAEEEVMIVWCQEEDDLWAAAGMKGVVMGTRQDEGGRGCDDGDSSTDSGLYFCC